MLFATRRLAGRLDLLFGGFLLLLYAQLLSALLVLGLILPAHILDYAVINLVELLHTKTKPAVARGSGR